MRSNFLQRCSRLAVAPLGLVLLVGCHEYVNPWEDDTVDPAAVSTASVAEARAHPHRSPVRQRSFAATPIQAQDGSVRHFPLWFEDPQEDRGSDDGRFAMRGEDYLGMPYGLARFITNGIAFPISAAVQPPTPAMVSDGVTSRQALGYDHDPAWRPDGVSSTPPDILEVGAQAPMTPDETAPIGADASDATGA
jgi:hypothetical protein